MTFTVFKVICLILILLVLFIYLRNSKKSGEKLSKLQLIIVSLQILIAGYFFALCLSDFYAVAKNFSIDRFVADIFCDIAYLLLTIYILFYNRKKEERYFKIVIWAAISFIAIQSFVVPYRNEFSAIKIFETIEGAVVYGILIAMVLNLKKASFGKKCILAVVILELIVAIANVLAPLKSIVGDVQAIDMSLGYQALFVRPILFVSIALAYLFWIDRHK